MKGVMKKLTKKKIIIIVVAVAVVFLAFRIVSTMLKPKADAAEVAVTVNTYQTKNEPISTYISLSGKIKPKSEVNVIPKVSGKVSNIYVEIGQWVNKGDLLFSIDKTDVMVTLQQAQAAYEISKESNVQAQNNLYRQKELFNAGAISQMQLDSAQSAELTTASAMKQAQATYQAAINNFNNTDVRSEINGYLSANNAVVGAMVSPAAPVMTVVDIKSLYIEVPVPERVINKIDINKEVNVTVSSLDDQIFTGKVIGISPSASNVTQAYSVKVEVENQDGQIKGGMFVSAKFILDTADNTIVVPVSAVKDVAGSSIIYVVDDKNRAHKKTIKKGISNESFIEISEGLTIGEKVVTKGQDFLTEGSLVEEKK